MRDALYDDQPAFSTLAAYRLQARQCLKRRVGKPVLSVAVTRAIGNVDVHATVKCARQKTTKLIVHDPVGQPAGDDHQFLFDDLQGVGQLFVMITTLHQMIFSRGFFGTGRCLVVGSLRRIAGTPFLTEEKPDAVPADQAGGGQTDHALGGLEGRQPGGQ